MYDSNYLLVVKPQASVGIQEARTCQAGSCLQRWTVCITIYDGLFHVSAAQ
jgi:hypothetical protein